MARANDDRSKSTQSKLGRGLGSLIPVPIEPPTAGVSLQDDSGGKVGTHGVPAGNQVAAPSASMAVEPKPISPPESRSGTQAGTVVFVPIRSIRPGKYQPRGAMDPRALDALAKSIAQSGLMQPIVVRRVTDTAHQFEIIAGERRWRAMDQLGRTEVPVVVQDVSDRQAAELSLIENLQREDLNPMDRATALRRLGVEFGLTHQDLAERVGIDRASVTNLLRLLDLDPGSASLVRSGALSMGHAKALLGVSDLGQRAALSEQAVAHEWSVRQLEAAIREQKDVPRGTSTRRPTIAGGRSAHLDDLCRQLEQHLGTRVAIRVGRRKGSGELRIQFFSLDEFDGLMQRIGFKGDRMIV